MRVTLYINPSNEDTNDLIDFLKTETWGGASDRIQSATDEQLEEVAEKLQALFYEPTDLTTINDEIWFYSDDIFEEEDEDEEDQEDDCADYEESDEEEEEEEDFESKRNRMEVNC